MYSILKNLLRVGDRKSHRRRRDLGSGSRTAAVVERLERRDLLTVVVTPQFGPVIPVWNLDGNPTGQSGNDVFVNGRPIISTPLAAGSNPAALKDPTIYLIFWGSGWAQPNSTTPIAAVQTLLSEAKTIVGPSSGYLKSLTEFGSDGQATIGGAWLDLTAYQTGGPNANVELGNVLNGTSSLVSVSGPAAIPQPTADPINSPSMYVIITTVNAGGGNGYDSIAGTKLTVNDATLNVGLNTPGINAFDNFSRLFSHELAERMVAGVTNNSFSANNSISFYHLPPALLYLSSPGIVPLTTYVGPNGGGDQVADFEPDQGGNYLFRLNGATGTDVQAVWSISRQAFIVTTSDAAHDYVLTPKWQINGPSYVDSTNTAQPGALFLKRYDLALTAASGDTISIEAPAGGAVKITWNGRVQTFDAGTIDNIRINFSGTGNHTVDLFKVSGIKSLTINTTGPGTSSDVVNYSTLLGLSPIPLEGLTSFRVATLAGSELFFTLNAGGTLQEFSGGVWQTISGGVKSFDVAPWTKSDLEFAFYLTTDGRLFVSDGGVIWHQVFSGIEQFTVGQVPIQINGAKSHTNDLFTLDNQGTLEKSDGNSTQTIATGVRQFQFAHWAGADYAFYLTNANALYSSIDGNTWVNQGSDIQSFAVGELKGDGYLFSLTTNGVLQRSQGFGWQPVATSVQSFRAAPWAGKNYVFYLDNNGTLFSSFDGVHWANQGNHIAAFDVGALDAVNTLFALTVGGTLQRSTGTGWQPVTTAARAFQMAFWAGAEYVFYLDSAGALFSSADGLAWANQGGPFQSFAVTSLAGVDYLFGLTGSGVLEQSVGGGWQPIAVGVQGFQAAPWAGASFVFYLDRTGTLFSSPDGVNWANQGGPFESFAAGNLGGIDYLFGLTGTGVLERSDGNGWQFVAGGVQSLQMARWAGANYVFYLDNTNTLYSSPDGVNWTNQGTGVTTFGISSLRGVNELFALTAAGVLQRSTGNGWHSAAFGVQSFQLAYWAGANYAFYLTFAGSLFSSVDGTTWLSQGTGVQSFAAGSLNGTGFLFALTSAGVFQRSTGSGWQTVDTGVHSLQMAFWAGTNSVFYLDRAYTLYSSPDGFNWANQGGPIQSFAVGSLQGTHYLFALTAGAVLEQSLGHDWQTVTIGVVSFRMASWAGADTAFYLDSTHTLATSVDGVTWVNQDSGITSFAVGALRGANELFDLSAAGVLKQSTGGGWNPVATGVRSFKMANWAGANYAFYLTGGFSLLSSSNGTSWINQGNGVLSFEVGMLSGVNELFDLTSTGILRRSTGSGWQTAQTGVRALQMGYWAGSNEVFYQDTALTLFSSTDGVNWANQGSGILSFATVTLDGVDYLFSLNSAGTLERSTGNFWVNVTSNVRFFYLTSSSGVPVIEYVTRTGQGYSSTDGINWLPV